PPLPPPPRPPVGGRRSRPPPRRRFPTQTLQVRPYLRSALVPQRPVLLHRLRDDPLQLRWNLPVQSHRSHRLPVEDRFQDLPRTLPCEGQHPRRHLATDRPERVQVRSSVQRLPPRLLRGHVRHRPHQRPRPCQLLRLARRRLLRAHALRIHGLLGQSEVQDLRLPPLRHEDVRGLDVPVDDPLGMGRLQRIRALPPPP